MQLQLENPFERVERLIGKVVTNIVDIFAIESGNGVDSRFLIAIGLEFDKELLVVVANSDFDSIDIELAESLVEWQRAHNKEEGSLRHEQDFHLSDLIGKRLINVWLGNSEKDHLDSIDMAFDNLLFPTIKILCVGSQLKKLRIVPIVDA